MKINQTSNLHHRTKTWPAILLSLILTAAGLIFGSTGHAAQVYIGGGDTASGAYTGYLNDPSGWSWVRQNADGYYINTFVMDDNTNDTTQNSNLSSMCGLFTHKNVFYETQAASSMPNPIYDTNDEARIGILVRNGFDLTDTTCNGNFTQTRATILQTYGAPARPFMALMGPWVIDGNIISNNANANAWRGNIAMCNGSATDSPLALWSTDGSDCQEGSYSAVKYSQALGKLGEVMLAPHGLGTDTNWLAMSEIYIRNHEDNGALPDIWAISYYAAYLEAHAVTPEQVSGAPGASITGVGYYLIHHLNDNDRAATLYAPAQTGLSSAPNGAYVTTATATQTYQVNLVNSSTWLDLIPVIKAQVSDASSAWNVTFSYAGQDITASVLSGTGFCFYQGNRLNPGDNDAITVTAATKSGAPSGAPLIVSLNLLPHPSTPVVNQTFTLQNYQPLLEAETEMVSGALIASNWPGYTGSGFVQYHTNTGSYTKWTNSVSPGTGSCLLQFRYANGGSTDRPLELLVNGAVINSSLSFPTTGTWTNWGTVSASVTMYPGANAVQLTMTGANGPNVDNLTVTPSFPSAPSNLTATDGTGKPVLSWSTVSGATGYMVMRSTTSGGAYTTIASTSGGSYTDTSAGSGATYYYVVTATNAYGSSVISGQAGATAGTIYEAEKAMVIGPVVNNNQPGFSGGGFVDYQNSTGDYVYWPGVIVSASGSYSLQFRYSLNGSANRPLRVTVNGSAVATNQFPGTGTWSTWQVTTNLVTLHAGTNTVQLTTIGSNGANLDYMGVVAQ